MKILVLEDSLDDVNLIDRELNRAGMFFSLFVVSEREEFRKAVYNFKPDVILSDHSLPSFNSIEALKIFKVAQSKLNLPTPFILVTGAVSEEFAVECIKAGADDYILKDSLKRLPNSIHNAVEKGRIEAERRRAIDEVIANESMLRQGEHMAHLGSWQTDLIAGIDKWSDEVFRLHGYEPGEVEPGIKTFIKHVHPEDRALLNQEFDRALENLSSYECKYRIIDKLGNIKHIHSKLLIHRDNGKPVKLNGFLLDITGQIHHIEKIEKQNNKLREIAWIQSHGVRAPLARIMGLVNLINANDPETNMQQLVNFILSSVEELDDLVRTVVLKTEELKD